MQSNPALGVIECTIVGFSLRNIPTNAIRDLQSRSSDHLWFHIHPKYTNLSQLHFRHENNHHFILIKKNIFYLCARF